MEMQTQTRTKFIEAPQRRRELPFYVPDIQPIDIDEVVDTLYSGWITTGRKVKLFEEKFADYVHARHAIAVNSCTGGLHVALAAADVGSGDEVIVPSMTFCATANVVVYVNAVPVIVDVEPDTLNIDPRAIEDAVTPRTKAIIPVHLYGHPVDMGQITPLAAAHRLNVIEDAAHAIAAEWQGGRIGSLSQATVFSFYATKNLTTAEGGMITTNDDAYAAQMRIWVLHGMTRDAWKRYTSEGSWYYEVVAPGFKYNMMDIQAALGLHQLDRIEAITRRREHLAARYTEGFASVPEIILPAHRSGVRHAWHLYPIRLRLEMLNIGRDSFITALKAEGVSTSVHFIPLHRHPYYRDRFGLDPADFPIAEAAYQQLISLPLYTRMTEQDVDYVVEMVQRIVKRHKR